VRILGVQLDLVVTGVFFIWNWLKHININWSRTENGMEKSIPSVFRFFRAVFYSSIIYIYGAFTNDI